MRAYGRAFVRAGLSGVRACMNAHLNVRGYVKVCGDCVYSVGISMIMDPSSLKLSWTGWWSGWPRLVGRPPQRISRITSLYLSVGTTRRRRGCDIITTYLSLRKEPRPLGQSLPFTTNHHMSSIAVLQIIIK